MSLRLSRAYHQMLSRDEEQQTGVCRQCGPVLTTLVNGTWRCGVQNGVRKRHLLSELDEATGTAQCARCGPVQIGRRSGRWACMTSVLEGRRGISMQRYGLSLAEYESLHGDPRCAICGITDDLHIDHDHVTGKVRGLLCGPHNRALGMFQDDIGLLESAISYLKRA